MNQSLSPQDFRRTRDVRDHQRQGLLGGHDPFHLVGAMVGSAAGWYAGMALLMPIVLIAISWFAAYHLLGAQRRALVPAFSVGAGQLLVVCAGFLLLGFTGPVRFNVLDLAWLLIGLVWLIAKPGRAVVYWLAFYEVAAGIVNVAQLPALEWDSPIAKGLVGALAIRVMALFILFALHQKLSRNIANSANERESI